MSYNKKIWANGDLITKEGMNNIEYGIYDAHDKINAINNKVEENTTDTNTAKQDISDIKLQIGTEELTTTSKKIKGAINDLSSQIKDITTYITPEMFGCKGDGVTDDTENLQLAINSAITNNKTLVGKGKTYLVSDTIVINGFINLDFNNSTIKANSELTCLMRINSDFVDMFIRNIVLDCNNLCDVGLHIPFAKRSSFSEIAIKNFKEIGLKIDNPTYCLRFNVMRLFVDTNLANHSETAIGIKVATGDIEFTDVYINNCKTAIWSSGNNRFINIHPSIVDSTIVSGSKCFDLSGTSYIVNSVIDTFEICFNITDNISLNVINLSIVNNATYYTQTTPFTIFNYSNKKYAKKTHFIGISCNNTLANVSSAPMLCNYNDDNLFDFNVLHYNTLTYSAGCYPISINNNSNNVSGLIAKSSNVTVESSRLTIKDKRVNINAVLKVTTSNNGLTEVALVPSGATPISNVYFTAFQGTSASNCPNVCPSILYVNKILTIRILDYSKGEYFVVNCSYDID